MSDDNKAAEPLAEDHTDERDPQDIDELYEKLLEALTDEEREQVRKGELLRFLRARKYDVEKAAGMFKNYLVWRKDEKMDTVLENRPEREFKKCDQVIPQAFHGYSKTGMPVYVGRWGAIKYKPLTKRVTPQEFMRCHRWDMEHWMKELAPEGARKMGTPLRHQITNIIDFEGLDWGIRHFLPYFKEMSEIDEANFPETMGGTFVINAPSIFPFVYNIAKRWMDPFTVEKVKIFTDCPTEELLKVIPADQLPKRYGGTCSCNGTEPCIPDLPEIDFEEQHAQEVAELLEDLNIHSVSVPAGKVEVHKVSVTSSHFESKSTQDIVSFDYYFSTEQRSIEFHVKHVCAETKQERELVPKKSHKSHERAVIGAVSVDKPGTLLFYFDNTSSYWNGKQVKYGIRLEASDHREADDSSTA